MNVNITLSDKDRQLVESIYEDKDAAAALGFVLDVIRPKIHEHQKDTASCGNIFSKSGEKK